jgi:antitoxin MazE
MKTTIIPIGNSRGIRIPKTVLEQCHIETEATLEVEKGAIVIRPARKHPRENWDSAFQEMRRLKEDNLFISDTVDADLKDWEW